MFEKLKERMLRLSTKEESEQIEELKEEVENQRSYEEQIKKIESIKDELSREALENYLYDKNIPNELKSDPYFLKLVNERLSLENKIEVLKDELKEDFFTGSSQDEIEEFYRLSKAEKEELKESYLDKQEEMEKNIKLSESLLNCVNKKINNVVGIDVEHSYGSNQFYTTIKDLSFEDGSFIKRGTEFIIEGLNDDYKYLLHFQSREDNIYKRENGTGEGYYLNEKELNDISRLVIEVEKKVGDIKPSREFEGNFKFSSKEDVENVLNLDRKDIKKILEKDMSADNMKFMNERGFKLDNYIEEYINYVKNDDFKWGPSQSFNEYLEEEIDGIIGEEIEEYNENTYMEQLERNIMGEKEYIKIYGKDNFLDNYDPYYKRLHQEQIQKEAFNEEIVIKDPETSEVVAKVNSIEEIKEFIINLFEKEGNFNEKLNNMEIEDISRWLDDKGLELEPSSNFEHSKELNSKILEKINKKDNNNTKEIEI